MKKIAVKIRLKSKMETLWYCESLSCSVDDGACVLGRGLTEREAVADFNRRAKLDGLEIEAEQAK